MNSNKNKQFSPQLSPNFKKSDGAPDWEELLKDTDQWLCSDKLDGCRVEIYPDGTITGRSLKKIPSVQVNNMTNGVDIPDNVIIEAEFWAEGFTFTEIIHFFKTEDVTSAKTVSKYTKLWAKTGGDTAKGWKFPGRDVKFLTTWHPELKFYTFNLVDTEFSHTFEYRINALMILVSSFESQCFSMIPQKTFEHIDEVYQMYDQVILDGGEGLILSKRDAMYKYGRVTLREATTYKMKDDNKIFSGVIMNVVEGTIAREGAQKTINELGRSKTSQLKEDRVPSGMASGFEVIMENGNSLTVSLNGFNHPDRIKVLQKPFDWLGKEIKFTGMDPVKDGGVPRHSIYTKEY